MIMKKIISILLMIVICMTGVACGKNEMQQANIEPEASQMKAICELATIDCYYHNVAKYDEEDASGALWWKKDRKFWIEYAGVVTVGIDATQVNIAVKENTVTITMPPAEILGCKVDDSTLTKESFIIADDSADVEAEHETKAFREAQINMEQEASEDTALLAHAQQRAQKLLEEYVENVGELVGKEYQIKWIYLDKDIEFNNEDSTSSIE